MIPSDLMKIIFNACITLTGILFGLLIVAIAGYEDAIKSINAEKQKAIKIIISFTSGLIITGSFIALLSFVYFQKSSVFLYQIVAVLFYAEILAPAVAVVLFGHFYFNIFRKMLKMFKKSN